MDSRRIAALVRYSCRDRCHKGIRLLLTIHTDGEQNNDGIELRYENGDFFAGVGGSSQCPAGTIAERIEALSLAADEKLRRGDVLCSRS